MLPHRRLCQERIASSFAAFEGIILLFADAALAIRLFFAYNGPTFDPDAHLPRLNKGLVYLGACLIAGIRMARERQVNVRVQPTSVAIDESIDLAHEIYNRVFRKGP